MVRSQVRRGRPGRRLQSLGNPGIDVYRALDVSCELPIRATCPKKRSRLVWMSGSNCGGEPARSRTSAVLHGLYRESGEYVGDTCCQRQQSCLPELRSRPVFQNHRGGHGLAEDKYVEVLDDC